MGHRLSVLGTMVGVPRNPVDGPNVTELRPRVVRMVPLRRISARFGEKQQLLGADRPIPTPQAARRRDRGLLEWVCAPCFDPM